MRFRPPSQGESLLVLDFGYLGHVLSWIVILAMHALLAAFVFDAAEGWLGLVMPGMLMAALIVVAAVRLNPDAVGARGDRVH